MPKEQRTRTATHQLSVKLQRRVDSDVGPVDGSVPGPETPRSATTVEPRVVKKKEKHILKRELFLRRLEAGNPPYSKSHDRRIKRKAREQIATGLSDLQTAIEALEEVVKAPETLEEQPDGASAAASRSTSSSKAGKIGKGKKFPLSKAQRKRALEMERLRHPLILANPDFSANPFQTIRTHAKNTLLKHQVPSK